MTEGEWLGCTDSYSLLEYLGTNISDRKFRLFGSACCRRIWELLENDETRRVVEVAEQVADGHVPPDRLGAVWYDAYRHLVSDDDADAAYNLGWGGIIGNKRIFAKSVNHPHFGLWFYAASLAAEAAGAVARSKGGIFCLEELPVERRDERNALLVDLYSEIFRQEEYYEIELIRCVFGNPFRPVALDPAWLTSSVVELARTIYEDRAFDQMPELAAALEEAGCGNAEVLAHCRQRGEHVRGCWVVDLLLGKE